MDNLQKFIDLELRNQMQALEDQQQILLSSPEGFLFSRHRKSKRVIYHQHKVRDGRSWRTVQTNITADSQMQKRLLKKKIAEKKIKIYHNNIPLLKNLHDFYLSTDYEDLMQSFPSHYSHLLKAKVSKEIDAYLQESYERCPYYPQQLNHRTCYNDFVRSKSEVIIANALYSYGIPFHYEEALFFNDYSQKPFYPDFTILLPHHRFLYWEHWGLLTKEHYCRTNTEKLLTYQEHDLLIGQNLIITQDDSHGNCQSHIVYDTIEKMILPHFRGIPLNRRII